MKHLELFQYTIDTPLGQILLVQDGAQQTYALDWLSHTERLDQLLARYQKNTNITRVEGQAPTADADHVRAYFDGDFAALDKLQIAHFGTEFQRSAWRVLREIPAGRTMSYLGLADRIGKPKAVRAVGTAIGANPISIAIPCHRIIGANGQLTGYAGGLDRKQWLLQHENACL